MCNPLFVLRKDIMKSAEKFRDLALDKVDFSQRYSHVAFVLSGNRIIDSETNKPKTHPAIKKHGYPEHSHLHAELAVSIRHGKLDCSDYSLVVVRIRSNKQLALSRPCKTCERVLRALCYKRVYYSLDSQEIVRLW